MRGPIAAAAPRPRREAFKCEGSSFWLDKFEFGPGAIFMFLMLSHSWEEAFVGGGLSKDPGPVGCYYDKNRVTTWILYEEGFWYTASVEAAPIPAIAKKPEPEVPPTVEDATAVYECLGNEFEDGNIIGRAGGFFSILGREYRTGRDTDYTCPATGVRVQTKGDIACVSSGNIRQVFKYAKPNILFRILTEPAGWYRITAAMGKQTRFNSLASCAFWSPATPILIVLLAFFAYWTANIFFMLLCALILPWPLLETIYSPCRRHLPKSFFDDGAEAFFDATRVHKAVKAAPFTHLSYIFSLQEQQR